MTSRTENQLIDDVTELGYAAMRAPASGARQNHYAGDVWIARRIDEFTKLFVVEEKYKSRDKSYIYEEGDKLDAMIDLSESIGATPLVAVRWSTRMEGSPGPTHMIADARDVHRTPEGNVGIKPQDTQGDVYLSTIQYFSDESIVTP